MSVARQFLSPEKIAKLDSQNHEIRTAIKENNIDSIRQIFDNKDCVDYIIHTGLNDESRMENNDSWSPIAFAITSNSLEIVKHFIELGVDCAYFFASSDPDSPNSLICRSIYYGNQNTDISHYLLGELSKKINDESIQQQLNYALTFSMTGKDIKDRDKKIILSLANAIPKLDNADMEEHISNALIYCEDNKEIIIALAKKSNCSRIAQCVKDSSPNIMYIAFTRNLFPGETNSRSEKNICLMLALGAQVEMRTACNCAGFRSEIRSEKERIKYICALTQIDLGRDGIVYIPRDLYEELKKEKLLDTSRKFLIIEDKSVSICFFTKDNDEKIITINKTYFGVLLNLFSPTSEMHSIADYVRCISHKIDGLIRLHTYRDFRGYNFSENDAILEFDFSCTQLSGSIITKEQIGKIHPFICVAIDVATLKQSGFAIESDMFSLKRYGDEVINLKKMIVKSCIDYINQESSFSKLLILLCRLKKDTTNILRFGMYKGEFRFKDTDFYINVMLLGQHKLFELSRVNGFQFQADYKNNLHDVFSENYLKSEAYLKKFFGNDNWNAYYQLDPVSMIAKNSNSSAITPSSLWITGNQVKSREGQGEVVPNENAINFQNSL